MMSNLFTKAESSFWQMVNPMLAKSNVVRKSIQQGAGLFDRYQQAELKHKLVITAAAGWILGMAGGAILAMII